MSEAAELAPYLFMEICPTENTSRDSNAIVASNRVGAPPRLSHRMTMELTSKAALQNAHH